jgi:NAD(P)H-hydrate epimerase
MDIFVPREKARILSREQVRAFDAWAINELGVPGVVLMENAGRSCAELIKEKLSGKAGAKVCIFCGTGNNGGDGFVIARHLLNAGLAVRVFICSDKDRIKGDAKINLDILEGVGGKVEQLDLGADALEEKIEGFTADADMVVDALFGTGLKGRLKDEYIRLIGLINNCRCPILAVDIPSGLDCDTGEVLGAAIEAECTITFAALKRAFVKREKTGRYTGEVYVSSIGVEPTESCVP